ncbi:MAG: hypothetical protein KBB52_02335 [Candidatus Omnitrophica bacterium]|nr:hypothetical protein [Candidatus Omnitrophota bacterium]
MDELVKHLKEPFFYYVNFITDVFLSKSEFDNFKAIDQKKRKYFSLQKLSQSKDDKALCRFKITLTSIDKDTDFNEKDFLEVFEYFKSIFKKERISCFARIVYHYPEQEFKTDPPIPIVLEEKDEKVGKIELTGVRLAFSKAERGIDSVILDLQECEKCKAKDYFITVLMSKSTICGISEITQLLSEAKTFSGKFIIKTKATKDA